MLNTKHTSETKQNYEISHLKTRAVLNSYLVQNKFKLNIWYISYIKTTELNRCFTINDGTIRTEPDVIPYLHRHYLQLNKLK